MYRVRGSIRTIMETPKEEQEQQQETQYETSTIDMNASCDNDCDHDDLQIMHDIDLDEMESQVSSAGPLGGQSGQVWWICPGESTADEKNIFSGVVDLRLTPYGELQGRAAGRDLRQKFSSAQTNHRKTDHQDPPTFHAIFTSNLHRAIQTKELALNKELTNEQTEQIIATEIGDRSMGVLTGENKSLLLALFGTRGMSDFMTGASPLGGESGADLYNRCSIFYQQQVQPRIDNGQNVLIVSHAHVMMAMASYLDDQSRNNFETFAVPSGMALTNQDLVQLRQKGIDPFHKRLGKISDLTTIWALKLGAILLLLGAVARVMSGSEQGLPAIAYKILLVVLGGALSLYTYLDVDLLSASSKVSRTSIWIVFAMFALRYTVAIPVIVFLDNSNSPLRNAWMLWLLVPPSSTTPGLARLVGGNRYEAATIAPAMNIFLPLGLYGIFELGLFPKSMVNQDALTFFWVILAGGLWLPCAVSQFCRWKSPVTAAQHTDRWKFLGSWALMILGLFTGYQTCPPDFVDRLMEEGISPLSWALGFWLVMRYTAILLRVAWKFFLPESFLDKRQWIDIFVLLTTPNFFLWLSLQSDFNSLTTFWAGFFFFGNVAFQHQVEVRKLAFRLCQATIGGQAMATEQINELVDSFDVHGNGFLQEKEFSQLMEHFYRNSGEHVPSKELLSVLRTKMMLQLGLNDNGEIPVEFVKDYLKENGCQVNFNSGISRSIVTSSVTSRTALRRSMHPSMSYSDFSRVDHPRSSNTVNRGRLVVFSPPPIGLTEDPKSGTFDHSATF